MYLLYQVAIWLNMAMYNEVLVYWFFLQFVDLYDFNLPVFVVVMKFGIALPKWIVEPGNSIWVLAAYGLLFMVIMPVVVVSSMNLQYLHNNQ